MRRPKYKVRPWEIFLSISWLSLLLGPFLLIGGLVLFALTSPADPTSPWWAVGVMLTAAAAFLGVLSIRSDRREKLAKKLIEEDCASFDGTQVTIRGRKRDYLVLFTQGAVRKSRTCRVHRKKRFVEWITAPAVLKESAVEDIKVRSNDVP